MFWGLDEVFRHVWPEKSDCTPKLTPEVGFSALEPCFQIVHFHDLVNRIIPCEGIHRAMYAEKLKVVKCLYCKVMFEILGSE